MMINHLPAREPPGEATGSPAGGGTALVSEVGIRRSAPVGKWFRFMDLMWLKQCHKPPVWEWFIAPIYGDLGDGLLLFSTHYIAS